MLQALILIGLFIFILGLFIAKYVMYNPYYQKRKKNKKKSNWALLALKRLKQILKEKVIKKLSERRRNG